MNGVSPEDADSSSASGLGSEHRTRFFSLLGVAGRVDMLRVDMPWHLDFEAEELTGERRFGLTLMSLFLLAGVGWSLTFIVK
jgi:hypothetical protein